MSVWLRDSQLETVPHMNGMPRRPVGLRLVDGFLDDALETWLHTVGVEEPLEIARAMKGVRQPG